MCKDGISRTLYRNSVTKELRVRRISMQGGTRITRYSKPI